MSKPSPVEILRRILSLERSQGYLDRSVVGGIARYIEGWRMKPTGVDDASERIRASLMGYADLSPENRQKAVLRTLDLLEATPAPPSTSSAPPAEPRRTEVHPSRPPRRPRATHSTPEGPSAHQLTDPVTGLKGVGKATAARMETLGIHTIQDLLYHFPRRYDDLSQHKLIRELRLGDMVTVVGVLRSVEQRRSGGRSLCSAILSDESGAIECTWFNQPYLHRRLSAGQTIALSGQVGEFRGRLVFSSPEWAPAQSETLSIGRVVPVYPLTEGLHGRLLRQLMYDALETCTPQVRDPLPVDTRIRHELLDLGTALWKVHFPDTLEEAMRARERLCFDELLLLQLGVLQKRAEWRSEPGIPMSLAPGLLDDLAAHLPFDLTGAQRRAIGEILSDLRRPVPMSRLLQGDVGSGKTVVAVSAMLAAVRAGYQVALMAPTSILAEQHAETIGRLLAHLSDIRIALLEGGVTAEAKSAIREDLATGGIDIVIGTHALIQESVTFRRLGLVIVDEQHRFGVAQRQLLRDKNTDRRPHMLAMSATPIPRTLALSIYGDLDLWPLDELPPNRQPVLTAVRTQTSREAVYTFVRAQLEQGRQAFVICPLVEQSEQIDARAAVEEHARLSQDIFPQYRLGLLHGRVGSDEKEAVMRRFKDGEFHILVSTAVVEVGVDVPNATVMLIEGAERFGLAQLHQFRGRVGRGEARSYCVLLSDVATEEALLRLQVMAETNDGFVLAERDLELRGPGDFLGVRQHGLPDLKIAQLTDRRTLDLARREALRIHESDPGLRREEHAGLAVRLASFWSTISQA